MASSDRKISEGLEHLRLADKSLKTSLFKWKPDYDTASAEYTKAAVCFKNAKAYEQARESYVNAANVQKGMDSHYHAAKSLEQAAIICKENKDLDQSAYLFEEAALLFQEHGTPDTAALTLEKAARVMEQLKPDKAIELYTKAAEVSEIEDHIRECAEFTGKAARLLIRCKRLDDAAAMLKREIDYYDQVENYATINKLVIAMVLVHLHRGDFVAADQFHKSSMSYPGFSDSEESFALDDLLVGFDEGDEEKIAKTVMLPLLKFMDNDFVKLMRTLPVPDGGSVKPKIAGASASAAIEDDDDESEDGIC